MLSGSTISSDLGKYTAIIDGTNFMAASENYLGENDVFDGSAYVIHSEFATLSLIVEPAQ